MRKISGYFLMIVFLFWFSTMWGESQKTVGRAEDKESTKESKKESEKVEKAEVFELQPLLKGINFVRIRCRFNNTLYYQGYRNPRDTKKEDFNLNKVERQFKEADIPITKSDIQKLYQRLETELKENGVRILDIQTADEKNSTVIPTITLVFDLLVNSPENYFIALDLTATKWMSSWSGEESIQAPVIIWWQKKLATSTATDLIDTLDKTSESLIEYFCTQLAYANAITPAETKSGPESKPDFLAKPSEKSSAKKTSSTTKKKKK